MHDSPTLPPSGQQNATDLTDPADPQDVADPAADAPRPPFRELRRGRDRKIAGVCSGLAEYFAIDPVVVRLLFVAGLFVGGATALVYPVAWILMPEPAPPTARADWYQQGAA